MGMFEKRRCAKFVTYVQEAEEDTPQSWQGFDLMKLPARALFSKFSLEPDTIDFVGHGMALHRDDAYLDMPAIDLVRRIRLYTESLSRYGKSPYIYPLYGLGELPQGFARLSAIYGGTYMLNAPLQKVVFEGGVAVGVQSSEAGNPVAKCKFIVADPSYFPEKVKRTGQVVRVICILSHPVEGTDHSESVQIIIPQKQVGRNSDIYVCVMSHANCVCPAGKFIAIVATTVETANPLQEVAPGLGLLGQIDDRFVSITDTYEPLADGTQDKVFLSKSYDATTHFETTVEDVMDMYRRITGKSLVLKPKEDPVEGGAPQQ
jgi:Rab GDP dissociation inhibitor